MKNLNILKSVLTETHTAAKAAGRRECMGLLGRRPKEDVVSVMTLLPALASCASATAEPIAVKRAADRMAADGVVPAGLWHSHGRFGVFHSGTDHATIRRLLPAMAFRSFDRPPAPFAAPTVIGPDLAVLPAPDGFTWVFRLVGEPIAGSADHLRAEWAEVKTLFERGQRPPGARLEADTLVLAGSEASLVLRIPPGATVTAQREDAALYKVAWLHSLVVNSRNEECVDCIAVYHCGGRTVIDQQPVAIVTVDDPAEPSLKTGGNGDGVLHELVETTEPAAPKRWAELCL